LLNYFEHLDTTNEAVDKTRRSYGISIVILFDPPARRREDDQRAARGLQSQPPEVGRGAGDCQIKKEMLDVAITVVTALFVERFV